MLLSFNSAQSTALNTSRLQVLRAREDLLQQLFEDAKKELKELNKDREKYEKVVENLILEVSKRFHAMSAFRL